MTLQDLTLIALATFGAIACAAGLYTVAVALIRGVDL